jgi:lactoylglutathione lyase
MNGKIALIAVLTDDVPALVRFYQEVLEFEAKTEHGDYVEFHNEGVRFAICSRAIMFEATSHPTFNESKSGQLFSLAFPCSMVAEVDKTYDRVIAKGAIPIKKPSTMPWNQRTGFFADPEGNIHEVFADLT